MSFMLLLKRSTPVLRRLFLRILLRLGSTRLLLWNVLLRSLRLADGASTSNGLCAKICPIALLGGVIDDAFVDPRKYQAKVLRALPSRISITYFGPDLFELQVMSFLLAAGRFWCFVFLVTKVTPPFSPGWMPTACRSPPFQSHSARGAPGAVKWSSDDDWNHTFSLRNPAYCVLVSLSPPPSRSGMHVPSSSACSLHSTDL